MKKIAIISQRYGKNINGGAEVHAQQIAHLLKKNYKVSIITTCAEDYTSWEPVMPAGITIENDIEVIRLENQTRDQNGQDFFYRKLKYSPKILLRRKLYPALTQAQVKPSENESVEDCLGWLKSQGPYIPSLSNYIKSNIDNFDVFIFFTALYYPTAQCLKDASHKSILVPLLHYETCSFFPVYNSCYKEAEYIFFNSKSEKKLAEKIYSYDKNKGSIVAVGIDKPEYHESHTLHEKPYIIYIGRVSESKGCHDLFEWFSKWKEKNKSNMQLLILGKLSMEAPKHPDIILKGFVSDDEKAFYLQHASALVIPSLYESLSLVVLESFAVEVPVLGNQRCETIKDHINDSQGGLLFKNQKSFEKALTAIDRKTIDTKKLGQNGRKYVEKNYTWDNVERKFITAIEAITTKNEN